MASRWFKGGVLATLLVLVLVTGARADGGAQERGFPRAIRPPGAEGKGVITVVPRSDHHDRSDMVEPGWRLYGNQGFQGYGYGAYDIPGEQIDSSLDRQRGSGCDPIRHRCGRAEPWWTR